MRKTLLHLGIPLVALGALRLFVPQIVFSFAGLDGTFAALAMLIGGGVVLLTSPPWQRLDFRPLFAVGALGCIVLTFVCLNSPTFFGLRATYISGLDLFVSIEGAILLGLAALEQKTEAFSVVTAAMLWGQVIFRKLHRPKLSFGDALGTPHYNT